MGLAHGYYQQPGHVIAAGVVLSLFALAAVGLRMWTRIKYGQGVRADDWLIIPAVVLTVAQGINLVVGVANDALATPLVVPPEYKENPLAVHTPQVVFMGKVEFVYELLLPLTLGFVKLSFLFFYVRIFAVGKTGCVNMLLYSMIVLVSLWTVIFFFTTLFECRLNFWAIWASAVDIMNNCYDTFRFVYAVCLSDFLTDVLIILIPIPLVWRLKLSRRRKLATIAIFLLGAVAVAASLLRLIMMVQLINSGFDPDSDEILTITTYMYWGMVECGVGVMAACLPSLSLLARVLPVESAWNSLVSVFSNNSSPAGSGDGSRTGGDGAGARARNGKAGKMDEEALPMRAMA